MNKILFVISIISSFNLLFGQKEIKIIFEIEANIIESQNFNFSLLHKNDTIQNVFKNINSKNLNIERKLRSQFKISDKYDSLTGVFTFTKGDQKRFESFIFSISNPGLIKTEINLIFSVNSKKNEFLKELSINHFFNNNELVIEPNFNQQLNSIPQFILKNNSNYLFWNNEDHNGHIDIYLNSAMGWITFQGPHLPWFNLKNAITKDQSINSICESYNNNIIKTDAFKCSIKGKYKFYIFTTKINYHTETNISFFEKGETLKTNKIIYIISNEFEIR